MEIVPTFTTTALSTFEYLFSRFIPHCKTFQIDIQDGLFVRNKTFEANELLTYLQNLSPEELKTFLPATFDFHLMVQDYTAPLEAIHEIQKIVSVRYIFVHHNFSLVSHPNGEHIPICPTLNPEDSQVSDCRLLHKPVTSYPALQVMTIHPGPQGQTLIPQQLNRIHDLRLAGYKGKIVVDGGINPASLQHITSLPSTYHPDIVCIGSYLSRAPDYDIGARIEALKALVH
ncbi:hypothetical protein KBB12_02300 [Candidatus Woesebacteria bacterium]|nr:hypothetical protein [Candidatus Woesebacteria bacterium]